MMYPKVAVHLTDDVAARFAMAAKRPGTTKFKIVNDALDLFLDPTRKKHLAANIAGSQRDLSHEVRLVHRDLDIVGETLGLWLCCFLTIARLLPAGDQESARIARRKPAHGRYVTRS